jgi:hypothetical protein
MSKNLTFKLIIDGDSKGLVVTGLEDISGRGFEVIREFECFRENAYLETGGVWTGLLVLAQSITQMVPK